MWLVTGCDWWHLVFASSHPVRCSWLQFTCNIDYDSKCYFLIQVIYTLLILSTFLYLISPILISALFTWFSHLHSILCEPGSSVGIATEYGLGGPGIESRWDEIFRPSRLALGPTQPPVKWVSGLLGGKLRPGGAADHSPPSSAAVMKSRAMPVPTIWTTIGPVTGTLYILNLIFNARVPKYLCAVELLALNISLNAISYLICSSSFIRICSLQLCILGHFNKRWHSLFSWHGRETYYKALLSEWKCNVFVTRNCIYDRYHLTSLNTKSKVLSLFGQRLNCLSLILRRSRTGTVWFYTSTSNKRAARPNLYTKSLTRDLKLMYSRLTLVRISIKL